MYSSFREKEPLFLGSLLFVFAVPDLEIDAWKQVELQVERTVAIDECDARPMPVRFVTVFLDDKHIFCFCHICPLLKGLA